MQPPEDGVEYDPDNDLFRLPKGEPVGVATPIAHPLSVTLKLKQSGGLPALSSPPRSPGVAAPDHDWDHIIRKLASWRIRRFHLDQADAVSPDELEVIQKAVLDAEGHLVYSISEVSVTPKIDLPAASRIHFSVPIDSLPEQLNSLGSTAAAGHRVRAMTILDPRRLELLLELGSELAVRNIPEWTISPPMGSAETHWLPDQLNTEPPFIARLRKQLPFMRIEYVCFPIREGSLIAQSDAALFTADPVTAKRSFLSWLAKMSVSDLLTHAGFDMARHLSYWLIPPAEGEPRESELTTNPSVLGETHQFDAFVSYDNDDWPDVKELVLQLKKVGIRAWVDKWEIQPGDNWITIIEKAIDESPVMLVLIGQEGKVASPYQEMEPHVFLQSLAIRKRRLIPVILKSAPAGFVVPPSLNAFNRVDLSQRDPDPFDLLVWGITGRKPAGHPLK